MNLIASETTKLVRYRVEMRTSIIFDVIMPENATEQEVTAQASMDYRNLLESNGGITLNIGLPDCRLYMCTIDDWNPLEIGIADIESYDEEEDLY
jgi:hypothetical protein